MTGVQTCALPICEVSDNLALRALELSSKAMGLGQAKAATVVVEANHLDNLAKRLVALRPRATPQGEVYEANAKEIGPGPSGNP